MATGTGLGIRHTPVRSSGTLRFGRRAEQTQRPATTPAPPAPSAGGDSLHEMAARFGLALADPEDLALSPADALGLVPHVARARIGPLRIGRTANGPIVALALETARAIPADRLSAIAADARGRLLLARDADMRHAIARSLSELSPDRLLEAADAYVSTTGRTVAMRPASAGTVPGSSLSPGQSERLAAWLGLPFADTLTPCASGRFAQVVRSRPGQACTVPGETGPLLALAPSRDQVPDLCAAACQRTAAALSLVFTHTEAIRTAGTGRASHRDAPVARWDLGLPSALSARTVLSPVQRLIAPPIAASAILGGLAVPHAVPLVLSGFLGSVLLALAAARGAASLAPSVATYAPPRRPLSDTALPAYTVLVPLYREATSIPALIRSLDRIDYPRTRLEILYLLEPDDTDTRAAFAARSLPPGHHTVTVPAEGPRTKPKALNAGLSIATGSLVTIFDAEDRPDPAQLRVAAETFAAGGPRLACLQARLAIDHARDTWITRMFAIEYACLFDVLLPWLSRRGLFFPLGGTSNHFRRSVLLRLGGWDPYNVTEDADLGVRLTRFDYEMALIASTTYEEAPLHMRAWMRQRTRWLKGWMQTWWVHMRRPGRFGRTRALAKITVFQSLILGSLLAILAFPLCLAFLVAHLAGLMPLVGGEGLWPVLAIGFNGAVFVIGFSATATLSLRAMRLRRLAIPSWRLIELPLYWLVMAAALVAAAVELARRPHHWAKTTHGIARRPVLRWRRRVPLPAEASPDDLARD